MSTPYQPEFRPAAPAEPQQQHRPLPPSAEVVAQPAYAQPSRPLPAPGWYQEPEKPGVLRYWNGVSWEEWRKPLVEAPSIDQGQKSVAVAYLLLLFVGGLGVHRFYLGRTGTGVTMLVLWLLGVATIAAFGFGALLLIAVGIWTLVDLFLVPVMAREAALRSIRPRL